jgi:hypothetical protein
VKPVLKALLISLVAMQGIFFGCTTVEHRPGKEAPADVVSRYSTSRAGDIMNVAWQTEVDTFYAVFYRDSEKMPWRLLKSHVRGDGKWASISDRVNPSVHRIYLIKKEKY